MKTPAASERNGLARYVPYQGYYLLIGRDYEWKLMPLGSDQKVRLMVWSTLGCGRLTGKICRDHAVQSGRIAAGGSDGGSVVNEEHLFTTVDVLDEVAVKTGRKVARVALNWLL